MKKYLLALIFASLASIVSAQIPEPVVSWDIEFWAAGVVPGGVGAPISISNFTRASATCGQAVANPSGTVINPTQIRVEDPAIVGRDCIVGPTTASGVLMALPVGNGIFATARARGATLISVRSAASNPFNRVLVPAPPVVPSNLRVLP